MGPQAPDQVVAAFWEAMNSNDFAAAAQHLSDDYVLTWPQSGERIRGRVNFAALNQAYPATGPWRFTVNRLLADGAEVVTDVTVTDGRVVARAITFSTVQEGHITRQVEYWPDPYDPPDWRAEWVERTPAAGSEAGRQLAGIGNLDAPLATVVVVEDYRGFVIREATAADVQELARLNVLFNDSKEPPAALAARLADPGRVELALVASVGPRLVGFAGLRMAPGLFYAEPQAELTEMYVEGDYRRRGIGRALVEEVSRRAAQAGAIALVVRTEADNAAAIGLYQDCGFFADLPSYWKPLGND